MKCPVCEKFSSKLYCANCVQAGNIIKPSTKDVSETLAEKRLRFLKLQEEYKNICESYDRLMEQENLYGDLTHKLRMLNKRKKALLTARVEQTLKTQETRKKLEDSKIALESEKKSCKSKEGKIELIKKIIDNRREIIRKRATVKADLRDEVSQLTRQRVYQLHNDIFSIEEINLNDQNNSILNMETSPLLTFSDSLHNHIDQQTAYSIVEPWLPSDGDYSAYTLWVSDNPDYNFGVKDDVGQRNPAYRISAALGYTTQLVKNISFFMDINLAAEVDLQVFNKKLMVERQFSYNVAKLNANIIQICVALGIDISLLNPKRTLKNLSMIFDPNLSDFSRVLQLEVDSPELASKIEDELKVDLSLVKEDHYDVDKFYTNDEDESDSEWELSDHINVPEYQQLQQQISSDLQQQQNSYIQMPIRFLSSIWGSNNY